MSEDSVHQSDDNCIFFRNADKFDTHWRKILKKAKKEWLNNEGVRFAPTKGINTLLDKSVVIYLAGINESNPRNKLIRTLLELKLDSSRIRPYSIASSARHFGTMYQSILRSCLRKLVNPWEKGSNDTPVIIVVWSKFEAVELANILGVPIEEVIYAGESIS